MPFGWAIRSNMAGGRRHDRFWLSGGGARRRGGVGVFMLRLMAQGVGVPCLFVMRRGGRRGARGLREGGAGQKGECEEETGEEFH